MRAGKRMISAEMPEELVEDLRMQAERERRSVSEIIREAVRRYVRAYRTEQGQAAVNE